MTYVLSFLEGIITFISPCLLPMLPVYVLYFTGGKAEEGKSRKTLVNALVFVALGAFMAGLGSLLQRYQTVVNLITGAVVIIFGLNFMGILNIGLLNGTHKIQKEVKELGFFSAVVFGIIFSIGWTPCVGTFLGSALLMASQQGSVLQGIVMLLLYSLGLGIPFLVSALLIDKLKGTFQFIKTHYQVINRVCGALLVGIGILMMTGLMSRVLGMLS